MNASRGRPERTAASSAAVTAGASRASLKVNAPASAGRVRAPTATTSASNASGRPRSSAASRRAGSTEARLPTSRSKWARSRTSASGNGTGPPKPNGVPTDSGRRSSAVSGASSVIRGTGAGERAQRHDSLDAREAAAGDEDVLGLGHDGTVARPLASPSVDRREAQRCRPTAATLRDPFLALAVTDDGHTRPPVAARCPPAASKCPKSPKGIRLRHGPRRARGTGLGDQSPPGLRAVACARRRVRRLPRGARDVGSARRLGRIVDLRRGRRSTPRAGCSG